MTQIIDLIRDFALPARSRMRWLIRCGVEKPRGNLPYRHHIALPKYKLVYFYLPKVACSSIKRTIAELLELPEGGSPHSCAFPRLSEAEFRSGLATCRSFAVIRDPIARLFSAYRSTVLRPLHDRHYYRGVFRPLLKFGLFRHAMSFEGFCEAVLQIPDNLADPHFRSQAACLRDTDGVLLARDLIPFGAMPSKLPAYLERITGRTVSIPRLNPSATLPLSLSIACRAKLQERFQSDYELLRIAGDQYN